MYLAERVPGESGPLLKPDVPIAVPAGDFVLLPLKVDGHGALFFVALPRKLIVCGSDVSTLKNLMFRPVGTE